jgi:hypothetical protein
MVEVVLSGLKQIYIEEQEVNDVIIALKYSILTPCRKEKVRIIDPDFP